MLVAVLAAVVGGISAHALLAHGGIAVIKGAETRRGMALALVLA